MPDLDATEDLSRLPAPGVGRTLDRHAARRLLGGALRNLDIALVLVVAVPALALGVPALGYLIGAGAWLLQRALQHYDRRLVRGAGEPRTQLGLSLFEAFGRIWLLAGAIILAGVVGGRADGLTAAITVFVAYSVAFAIRILSGRPEPMPTSSRRGRR